MQEYKFTFAENEINYILGLLSKQPYIEVADLIDKIHKQANEQETQTN